MTWFSDHKAENRTLDEADAVGVAGVEGADGSEAPLWEAEDDERVGEALREPGLERRPRERNAARPWDAPSGRMNFSLSSRLVRPRAADRDEHRQSRNKSSVYLLFLVCLCSSSRGQQRQRAEWGRESRCFLGCRHHSRCGFIWECMSRVRVWSSGKVRRSWG